MCNTYILPGTLKKGRYEKYILFMWYKQTKQKYNNKRPFRKRY